MNNNMIRLVYLTTEEFMKKPGISDKDKQLIESTIGILGETGKKAEAMRAYYYHLWTELIPDDDLRADIEKYGAAWGDGWEAGVQGVIFWKRGPNAGCRSLKNIKKE